MGILLFVGLPLIGWGVTDIQGFITHPARLGYILLVVLLQVLVVIKLPEVGGTRSKGKRVVRRQRVAVLLMQVISLAIVITAPFSDRRDVAVLADAGVIRYLGLAVLCLGFLAMHWAEASLGKQFSVDVAIQEGHSLVTEGPYRHLRHPRYLGIILLNIGISLVYRSWLALLLVAAMTLVLIWRIRDEETLMHQTFGTDWEDYSRRSWRLVPYVY